MILGIDHVGLATDDPAGMSALLTVLGLREQDAGRASDYGVDCAFWATSPRATSVELVSPHRADSAVSSRLAGGGAGLYHLAVEVDDLDAELARLCTAGLHPVDREPCAGARPGMRVAFVYAKRPARLLIELVQYPTPRALPTHQGETS